MPSKAIAAAVDSLLTIDEAVLIKWFLAFYRKQVPNAKSSRLYTMERSIESVQLFGDGNKLVMLSSYWRLVVNMGEQQFMPMNEDSFLRELKINNIMYGSD